jgi:hypothetical protein
MNRIKERYIVDEHGNRAAVVLDIADYQHLLEQLEELDALRTHDQAKAAGDEIIPFEQAIAEIAPDVSLDQLAREQGVLPIKSIDDLRGGFWPDDENIDEFIAAVRRWRHEGER